MADRTAEPNRFAAETAEIATRTGPVEILVGIMAGDHAGTIVRVAEMTASGLASRFPDRRSCLLVLVAGSHDGTAEALQAWRAHAPAIPPIEVLNLGGAADPSRLFRVLLETACRLEAAACAFVQADLLGLTPERIGRLLAPVLAGQAEAVLPAYTRTATEGTLTSNLLAPLTRALFGKRIQQLLGGCGAFSGGPLASFLADSQWDRDLGPHGIEVWLILEALASGRPLVEVALGGRRVSPAPGQPDLPTTLTHAVGPLFALLERYHGNWMEVRGSVPVPCLGNGSPSSDRGEDAHTERMVRAFRMGVKDLLPVWEQIVPEETLGQLYPLGLLPPEEFEFPVRLWARIVCKFALAHHERRLPREHLLRALTPLYLGRVAAFLREARAGGDGSLAPLLEAIGLAFEAEAEMLRERWR